MADRLLLTWEPAAGLLHCDRAGLNSLIAHTRAPESGAIPPPPDAALALLERAGTGDAVRRLLRPVHESASQVNCVIATPDRLTFHRAWITPENTTLLSPSDDIDPVELDPNRSASGHPDEVGRRRSSWRPTR